MSESTPNFTPNWCPKVSEIKGRYIFMYVLPWQMNTQPPGQDLPLLLHEILHEIHTWYKTMTPEYTWICFATDSWKLRTALRHTMYHSVEAGRTTLGPKHLLPHVAFSCMGKYTKFLNGLYAWVVYMHAWLFALKFSKVLQQLHSKCKAVDAHAGGYVLGC